MADITRDSFNEGARYVEVVFQRGRDVLDAELNELQKNARVASSKALRVLTENGNRAIGDGFKPYSDGVTANQLEITAGLILAGGYAIELAADASITGLSTPGGARTDIVWMSLSEQEVDSVADVNIAVNALGETSVRTQLVVTFGVAEGAALPADSGSEPWEGGTRYFQLGTLLRTAVAAIATATVIDQRGTFTANTRADGEDDRPRVSFADEADEPLSYFDVNGQLMGVRSIVRRHEWVEGYGASASQSEVLCHPDNHVHGSAGANCSALGRAPGAGGTGSKSGANSFRLTQLDAATSQDCVVYGTTGDNNGDGFIEWVDDQRIVLEWRMLMSAVGANEVDIVAGISNNNDITGSVAYDFTAQAMAMFRKLSSDTNWQVRTSDGFNGAITAVDTGVPPVANTWQRFRIEFYGKDTALGVKHGTVGVARFYIDGTLVAQVVDALTPTTALAAQGWRIHTLSTAAGPTGNWSLDISPIYISFLEDFAPNAHY